MSSPLRVLLRSSSGAIVASGCGVGWLAIVIVGKDMPGKPMPPRTPPPVAIGAAPVAGKGAGKPMPPRFPPPAAIGARPVAGKGSGTASRSSVIPQIPKAANWSPQGSSSSNAPATHWSSCHTDAPATDGAFAKSAPAHSSHKWRRIDLRDQYLSAATDRDTIQLKHNEECDELKMQALRMGMESQNAIVLVMRARLKFQEIDEMMAEKRMRARQVAEAAEQERTNIRLVQTAETEAFEFAQETTNRWKGVRHQLQYEESAVARHENTVRRTLRTLSNVEHETQTCASEYNEWDDRVTALQKDFRNLKIAQEHRLARDEGAEREIVEIRQALAIMQRRENLAGHVFNTTEVSLEQALSRSMESEDAALRAFLMQAALESNALPKKAWD